MTDEQVIAQFNELIADRRSLKNGADDDVYDKDIEALKRAISAVEFVEKSAKGEAVPVNQWTKTNDKLPDKEGFYFVLFDDNEIVTMYFDPMQDDGEQWGYWHNKFDSATLGFIGSEFESVGDEYVSFWLNIPEFPERKKS